MAGASLLGNTRFLRLWAGQGISFVGDAVSMVAMVVLTVQLTGSASAVGGLLVARLLPTLASPLVGVLADRLDRRAILVTCDLARAALVIGLVFVQDVLLLYVLVFFMGVARTFFNPTIRAAFPGVVGAGDLTRANAVISGTFSVSVAVGPALGGLLVAVAGVEAAFLLDSVTYLISAVFLATIPLPRPEREGEPRFLQEMSEGLGYLAGARLPLGIVLGAFLTILAMNVSVPAEIFLAKNVFGAGDAGYGLLVGLYGAGMVLGAAVMAFLGKRARLIFLYFAGIFLSALSLVAAGVSPAFALALGALMLAGLCNGVDNVTTDTILQEQVPEALLGRVFAVRFLTYSMGEVLAYPAGGLLVDALGARSTYLLAGAATAVAGLLILMVVATAPAKGSERVKPY